jgi:hypothetical protein
VDAVLSVRRRQTRDAEVHEADVLAGSLGRPGHCCRL